MTPELFSDAMNEIGAKYVEEALTYKRPAQRSFWSKLAKRAAMVALVALLALSGFAAASPDARAAMIHWVETWTGSQVSYEYAGDAPTGELPFYAITALPDGYTLDEDMSYEDSGFRQLCYRSRKQIGRNGDQSFGPQGKHRQGLVIVAGPDVQFVTAIGNGLGQ